MNQQVKARLKRISLDFDAAVEVLHDVVLPVIGREVESDTYAAELAAHAARLNEELRLYLERGKAEKEAMLGVVKEDEAMLRTVKYQLENTTLLIEEMTLTKLLASAASRDDIKQAVIHAVMVGDRGRILEGLREGIKQVESN